MNSINRVTHERIEDGVVTSGKIASAATWSEAFVRCIGDGFLDAVIAKALLKQMENIFDSCRSIEDIAEHDAWLLAAWNMVPHLKFSLVANDELARLRVYEEDIRNGKNFTEEEEDE